MNLFQWIILPLLVAIIILDLQGLQKRRGNLVLRVSRSLAWCVALVMIANPVLTSEISHFLGIGRGTDLVVYVFMLVTPLLWFRSQAQIHGLQRQVIALARIEAKESAVKGGPHHG